jgi:hypothetical protein
MDDDWPDDVASYEAKLSPFGKLVYRTGRRIQRYELKAKLAEAKARAAASKTKVVRKGRNRRRSGPASHTAPPNV